MMTHNQNVTVLYVMNLYSLQLFHTVSYLFLNVYELFVNGQ